MKTTFSENRIIDHPRRTILTIYTGPERFYFSLYDPEEAGSYFYKEFANENKTDPFSVFKETFFDTAFLSLPFRKVWIMNRTPGFAFVPHSFYKDEYKDDFMRFLFSEQKGIILTDSISHTGIKVVYQLPEEVYQFMLRSFPQSEFIHYSTPVITYFIKNGKRFDASQMVVNFQEKGVDIFCFSGKTFLLGNYFPCNGLSDMLYYILFTWKQLQLDQLNDYLHIAGNFVIKGELINKLTPYFRNIYSLSDFSKIYFEGIETEKIPFELAALSLCGL